MKLQKKLLIAGQLEAVTGLLIGGTNASMNIGGVDKQVIRNPVTNEPYIPGSSLKGKMRSLLELRDGTIGSQRMGAVSNGPTDNQEHRAARLFGNAARKQDQTQRPSRLVVRDAYLSLKQSIGHLEKDKDEFFKQTDLPFTEIKTEVVIDRITSRAMPRQMERVPAGAKFDFEMVLNIFEGDNEKELIEDLFSAMQLLQNDYLGASGSRGYGQIRFLSDSIRIKKRSVDFYKGTGEEMDITNEFKNYFPK